MDNIIVRPAHDNSSTGTLTVGDRTFPCALGKRGITAEKREGDLKTPVGIFPLRTVFYRYDKLAAPIESNLPLMALMEEDGWCDDPKDPAYNQFVTLPYDASAEHLWRDDDLYDIIVVLGHNDNPVESGKGSAIFLHIAKEIKGGTFAGTEGCIALKKQDLLEILPILSPETVLKVVMI